MSGIELHKYHEGFFLTTNACAHQRRIPLFATEAINPFDVAHQLEVYAPNKSSVHVDMAATGYHDDVLKVHSLLKVKRGKEVDECPESEVTACGSLFHLTSASSQPWISVYILSKLHLKIGLAFRFIGDRWAYSEFFEKIANFDPQDKDHILCHL
jgi:hypothetical protein